MAAKEDKPYTLRLLRDIREFYKEDSKDMFIVAEENDITVVHALIIGPDKTPYQNGFFYFVLRYPSDYPLKPPAVKLITTGGLTVRFNPNLYSCGKVCLSILGTWQGPAWSAAQTLFSTLLSIQTIMNEKPYHNEPGYEEKSNKYLLKSKFRPGHADTAKSVNDYNELITHETLRVAVICMVDEKSIDARNMPQVLKNIMISQFKSKYQFYEELIRSKLSLDGKPVTDPFRDPQRPKIFEYKKLLEKLLALKDKYQICLPVKSVATACSASTASEIRPNNSSDKEAKDELTDGYKQMATKMMAEQISQPRDKPANEDNWDDLINSMNEDLNDDTLDSYSSESDEEEPME